MSERHILDANLKRLKLSGMLTNLDIRMKEANDNDLSYLEFLSLLSQDEIIQRDNNMFGKRIKSAGFCGEKTFEDYNFKFNEEYLPAKIIRELGCCRFIDMRENVVIAGPPGIGKTHIAKAIGHQACRRGNDVLYKKAHQLLEELLQAKNFGRYEKLFKKCLKADVLILDDFAFRKMDSKEAEIFYSIVDEKVGRSSIIITSNRPPQDWIGIFPDMVMGGAILDRVVSSAHKLIITKAKSYRKEGKKE